MKYSFSTLGCPDWSWDDIIIAARDLGYDGIELRGVGREIYTPKAKPFLAANINKTLETIKKLNLEISCLTSGCFLNEADNIEEAIDYIDLASAAGIPYVRVLGDKDPQPGIITESIVLANLQKLASYAAEKNVILLVETNGVFANSEALYSLIEKVASPNVAVLWDIHHTYRYFGESPEQTYSKLGKYIKHVHIKDSKVENTRIVYKMMGYGDIPVSEAITVLDEGGYDGFISLEWVKRWCMELEEPAIVFAHFINYMKNI